MLIVCGTLSPSASTSRIPSEATSALLGAALAPVGTTRRPASASNSPISWRWVDVSCFICFPSGPLARASPRPATVELDFQREAQERPDQDDQPEDGDVLERRLDGDGPDDVGGHQELQREQDAACEDGSDGPVDAARTLPSDEAECAAHYGCREAHEHGRDAEDLHAPCYVIHGLLEAHLFLQSRGGGAMR